MRKSVGRAVAYIMIGKGGIQISIMFYHESMEKYHMMITWKVKQMNRFFSNVVLGVGLYDLFSIIRWIQVLIIHLVPCMQRIQAITQMPMTH